MERLESRRKSGINGNGLRTWGWIFLASGIIGRGVIQTHMLGIRGADTQMLLSILGSSEQAMLLTSVSIFLQAMEACATPVFALLLVEGLTHTSNVGAYFKRVLLLALIGEIPYNLALCGKLLDFSGRNHVFGIVLAMVMVYFWKQYPQKSLKNGAIKLLVLVMTVLWCQMLKVDGGGPLVVLVAVLWRYRDKTSYRNFAGAAAAMVCTIFSPFFLASPMAFLAIHAYNGEPGTNSHKTNYLAYPVMLLIAAAMGVLL